MGTVSNLLCVAQLSDCFSFLSVKVAEIAGEGHGGRNSARLERRAGGFGELQLYTDQWPDDSSHGLRQPHSDAYVYVLVLMPFNCPSTAVSRLLALIHII